MTVVIIVMGVAGAGKTTVGQRLAGALGWPFYDGDDFHPPANIEKMRQGIPLTNTDRDLWLTTLQRVISDRVHRKQSAIVACSALKQAYRDRLHNGLAEVCFVYLNGDYTLIFQRLQARQGHFMPADLLASQFATLEEPQGVFTVDVAQEPDVIVERIKRAFHL
jgi:gluconokinase